MATGFLKVITMIGNDDAHARLHFLFEAEGEPRKAVLGGDVDLAFDRLLGARAGAVGRRQQQSAGASASAANARRHGNSRRLEKRARVFLGLRGRAVMQPFQPANMPVATA